jgi:hypothetical protein
MKLNKYLALATIASVFAFTACEDDPIVTPADPTIAITGTPSFVIPVTATANPTVSFVFTVDAPGKIKNLKIVRTEYLGTATVGTPVEQPYNVAIGATTYEETFTSEVMYGKFHKGEIDEVEFMVIVTDNNDKIASAEYIVTMGAYTALATEITTGEMWKLHSTGKACWDLKNDVAVTAIGTAAEANRYIINSDNVGTLNDPSNFTGSWTSGTVNWTATGGTAQVTTGNGTKYVKANIFDYTNAKKEKALYMFNLAGTADQLTSISNPAVNDIYIAKKGDELYVIKITVNNTTEVAPTKANTGVLKFTYKK